GGALFVVLVLAFVFVRRTKRAEVLAHEADERHDARVREVLDRRRARAEEHAAQQRAHDESMAKARAIVASASERPPPPRREPPQPTRICPTCGREFKGVTAFCPHDGVALVPTSGGGADPVSGPAPASGVAPPAIAAALTSSSGRGKRGKICPTCGD